MVRTSRRFAALALAALLAVGATGSARAAEQGRPAWKSADAMRRGLFGAQTDLILGDRGAARRELAAGVGAYTGTLRDGIRAATPDAGAAVRRALARARRAVRAGDERGLAAARGGLQGAVFRGAAAVTLAAVRHGDVATARSWLLLREFRTATRLTRPGVDATRAVDGLATGRMAPAAAAEAVRKDLLDAYQGRQRDLLADADDAAGRRLRTPLAEAAAQAAGYWPILAPRYAEDRGGAAADRLGVAFAALAAAARRGDVPGFRFARRVSRKGCGGARLGVLADRRVRVVLEEGS